jgi:hypothetical protein
MSPRAKARGPKPRFPEDVSVDGQVERDNEEPEYKLNVSREGGGVEERQDVMLDEAAGVRRATRLAAKPMLQRGERADPTSELNRGTPDRRGHVQVGHPSPSEYQQATQHYEQHEEEVQTDDEVGEVSG